MYSQCLLVPSDSKTSITTYFEIKQVLQLILQFISKEKRKGFSSKRSHSNCKKNTYIHTYQLSLTMYIVQLLKHEITTHLLF